MLNSQNVQASGHVFGENTKPRIFRYKFPLHVKHEAIELAKREGIARASALLSISKKNIYRWMNKGFFHKRGGGRKTRNPEMERLIVEKSLEYIRAYKKVPPRSYTIEIGKFFISENFKASKGWVDKFITRNRHKFSKFLTEVSEVN